MLVTTSPPEYFPAATSVLLASRGFSSSNQRKTGRGKDSPAKIMGMVGNSARSNLILGFEF